MSGNVEIDPHSGIETTGHEWDGIKELNKPLPRWWVWVFYATIIWTIGYTIAYPAWPMINDYTKGVLGYSERVEVMKALAASKAGQVKYNEAIKTASVADIKANRELLTFAVAAGRAAFASNCVGCHGRGAQGSIGYPNLNDDNWIWGGTVDAIHQTISYGVRSGSDQARQSQMPKFGLDNMLTAEQINDVAEYVLKISGQKFAADAADRGKTVFAENCVVCHGEDGKGNPELGSPNLTGKTWLYGGTKEAIVEQVRTGRGGVMPSWADKLEPETVKTLAVYVHSLGGGQ